MNLHSFSIPLSSFSKVLPAVPPPGLDAMQTIVRFPVPRAVPPFLADAGPPGASALSAPYGSPPCSPYGRTFGNCYIYHSINLRAALKSRPCREKKVSALGIGEIRPPFKPSFKRLEKRRSRFGMVPSFSKPAAQIHIPLEPVRLAGAGIRPQIKNRLQKTGAAQFRLCRFSSNVIVFAMKWPELSAFSGQRYSTGSRSRSVLRKGDHRIHQSPL